VHPAAADPPDRVARISYISRSVSVRSASMDEWSAATRNYPLTVGDHLWTDRGARAELELGSTFVRIAPSTEFSVLNLDDRIAQLRITQGVATLRVRDLADEGVEIDTPNGAVTINQPGFYRIDVDDSGGRTTVTARSGRAGHHDLWGGPHRPRSRRRTTADRRKADARQIHIACAG